ncbi:hypothetical protein EDD85DRAFT_792885 [Armillaria nabsnona]|nr:hypothetical protein EDD85DRAFT_792885 [Armillaria nabsnona]
MKRQSTTAIGGVKVKKYSIYSMQAVSIQLEAVPLDPPIHSLPPEILSEIFLLTTGKLYSMFNPHLSGPWRLARVCHRWRDTAAGLPALWSSFMLDWPTRRQADIGARLLQEALQRTGQRRLSMTIQNAKDFPDVIMETLVQHSSQWGYVNLLGPPSDQLTQLLLTHNPRFPLLTTLSIQCSKGNIATLLGMFRDAPNLRYLYYDLDPEGFSPGAIHFPWSRITDLTMPVIHYGRVEQCVEVLRLCPSLEHLEEGCLFPCLMGTEIDPIPLTLRKLRSLSVGSSQLLPYIICPVLERLSLNIVGGVSFSPSNFSQFILHSCSRLQSLRLGPLEKDISDPGQLLSCMPQLRELLLNFRGPYREIFTGKISLEGRDEDIVSIIDKRWNVPQESRQLRQVLIYCDVVGFTEDAVARATQNRTLSCIERLELFKMDGLDVSINARQFVGMFLKNYGCVKLLTGSAQAGMSCSLQSQWWKLFETGLSPTSDVWTSSRWKGWIYTSVLLGAFVFNPSLTGGTAFPGAVVANHIFLRKASQILPEFHIIITPEDMAGNINLRRMVPVDNDEGHPEQRKGQRSLMTALVTKS